MSAAAVLAVIDLPEGQALRAESLPELLGRVDALTVHTPATEETIGMIGQRELALLKKDAIVVNAARGGIVEEAALVEALKSGHLFAAGVDVVQLDEPYLQARAAEAKALRKLKHPSRSRKLRSFLDQ
mgnify:CR=1 FL=1